MAEDLIRRKVTSPKHLGTWAAATAGCSWATCSRSIRDLFGAIVCQVPLLDMQRYHKLLAGASWMAEYGNPDEPKEWEFIRTFSPVSQRDDERQVPADAVHHLDARRPGPSRATPARWWRRCRRWATTCSSTRTSRAATAAPRTTSSGRSCSRWRTRSCGSN